MLRSIVLASLVLGVVSAAGCASADASSSESDIAPSPFWRSTLAFPSDPFVAGDGSARWVKFSIFTSDPTKVFFHDTNKFAFHYDFAKAMLPEFGEMTPSEFSLATLKKDNQRLVTGVVLLPQSLQTMEYGIQIIREDAYSKEEVQQFHDLVKSKIVVDEGARARAFYMPTFEQSPSAMRDRTWLEEHGIVIGSPERWLTGDACYAGGWAFGPAKFFAGSEIEQAYLDGRLTTSDILITDGTPAEVPFVAGIVSLTPSTPSSHVAILSKTWGTPFVYPIDESARTKIRALVGKEIALRTSLASDLFGIDFCKLEVIEPRAVDAQTRSEIAALRKPAPVTIPVKAHFGRLTKPSVALTPADVKFFGGKATNFGTLRRTIPENSPDAMGISFDLWDAFLAQRMPSGKTLRQEIDGRLGGLSFPPDMRVLEEHLQALRDLVTEVAVLPSAEKAQLLSELQAFGFDPKRKIRFRSSTNVEDGDVLSGAGLYDSFSGCLADDLDGDEAGPSVCDAGDAKERGVERAIKKVYASFFNTNAVLERLKYAIPESDVGMALAVHHSFPDETEAANGVATVKVTLGMMQIELVSQPGAESVTNPDGGGLPEQVSATVFDASDAFVTFRQGSNLVPLGAKVMTWESDYTALAKLIVKASEAFKKDHRITADDLSIDIEYKKDTSGQLVLKQIRQIPERSQVPSVIPVLLDEPTKLCTFQGEFGHVLANHRIKARGDFRVAMGKLSDAMAGQSIVSKLDFEMFAGGTNAPLQGKPSTFPGASHSVAGHVLTDRWDAPFGSFELGAEVRRLYSPAETPLVLARDLRWIFSARYATPRPGVADGSVIARATDEAMLGRCVADDDVAPDVQTVEAAGPNGLVVKTMFHYRKPIGAFDKTASLGKWEKTEIRGLTQQPIVLEGWFSQTFRPGHHNFSEDFAFEPALEDGLPAAVRSELDAKDIQTVIVLGADHSSREGAQFFVVRKRTQKLERL